MQYEKRQGTPEQLSFLKRHQLRPMIILDDLQQEFDLCMLHFPEMGALDVSNALHDIADRGIVDTVIYSKDTLDLMRDVVLRNQIKELKDQKAHEAKTTFPNSDEEAEVMQPNRFIKEAGVSSSYRPQLRAAKDQAYSTARTNLYDSIKNDDMTELIELDIEEDEVLDIAVQTFSELRDNVICAAKNLKDMLNENVGHHVTLQGSDYIAKEIKGSFTKLSSSLAAYKQAHTVIIDRCHEQFTDRITSSINEVLEPHYQATRASAVEQLQEDIVKGYEEVSAGGIIYSRRKSQSDSQNTQIKEDYLTIETPTQLEPFTLDSPFEWADEDINFAVLTTPEQAIITCQALFNGAGKISHKLRTRASAGSEFDRMWKQIQDIELHQQAGVHQAISIVRNIDRPELNDLTVLGYGNNSPNAKRMYYIKTNASRYPELAEAAEILGIEGDPTLLIKIAETDKANQLRTFHSFGITSRAFAKAGNAGSI